MLKYGVPFDVAFAWPDWKVLAALVAGGEADGAGNFDWDAMQWRRRP